MKNPSFGRTLQAFCLLALASILPISVRAQDLSYYWVVPSPLTPMVPKESFVIQVDAEIAEQIEAIKVAGFPGFAGQIAVGAVDYNKDYFAPGQPAWNWHVASIDGVFDLNGAIFPLCECPYLVADPSDIASDPAEWIEANGTGYVPIRYVIAAKIDPNIPDAVANVSNRAFTGAGERTAITGFIITGGQPRNIIVRGLGPSLGAQGVEQYVANPQIDVFGSSSMIATNTDWKTDSRSDAISASYSSLAPSDEHEAALLLTLLPGAYTVQTKAEDGSEGIVLTEVFDVDQTGSMAPEVEKKAE